MTHPEEHFSAYLDGELKPAERQAVEAHLAECSACSEKLNRLLGLNELLLGASSIEPSSEFSSRVMQRIDQEKRTRILSRTRWTILGLAAAIVLLVLILRIQQETITPIQVKKPKTVVSKPQPEKTAPQKPTPPRQPIVTKKQPNEQLVQPHVEKEDEQEKVAELKPVQPEAVQKDDELTSEEVELIANLDELENMDLITNYDQLQNLDIALMTSDEERQK